MDFAVERARILFSDGLPAGLSDHETYFLIKSFGDNYNSRQYEYSSMKLFLDGEDGGLKNVLAREFGKRICLDAGVFNPEVISLMTQNAQSIFMMMTKIASAP